MANTFKKNNTAQLYFKLGKAGNFHRFLSVHVVVRKSVTIREIGRLVIYLCLQIFFS